MSSAGIADGSTGRAGAELAPGVSVIIPSRCGAALLPAVLGSLACQSLERERFTVIVVLNGSDDGSQHVLAQFHAEHPDLNLEWVQCTVENAGAARNCGLQSVRREYVTFVDVDDSVAPRYLEQLLAHAGSNTISVAPFLTYDDGGCELSRDYNAQRFARLRGRASTLARESWVLGFNAAKLVPTQLAWQFRYPEQLRSGEDVVYWAHFLTYPQLTVQPVTAPPAECAYRRTLRGNSVSRQKESYEFNVSQRIAVIQSLHAVPVGAGGEAALELRVEAQAAIIARFIAAHPEVRERVYSDVHAAGVADFPWSAINNYDSRRTHIRRRLRSALQRLRLLVRGT
ncbi:MAG: glycosyltransferase [Arcanobacterium sp.]|nr:glycosyltransferase [Arcanobacterium sp.]